MSNSSLVNYTSISPNSTNPRKDTIKKITIHHMAGNLSVESCGSIFASASRQASSNYGIGTDGRVGMYVEEKNRSWCSSSADNDNQAVTIEVANNSGDPNWTVSDTALDKLIELCVDICKRNGISALNYTGDTTGNLTMHKWFTATACPGPYLESKFSYIAEQVNKELAGDSSSTTDTLYRVQVGAFSSKSNADNMVASVEKAGFDTYLVQVDGLYKVQVGAFANKDNAENQKQALVDKGFDAFITTVTGEAVSSSTVLKSITEIALEVISGDWGNGTERKEKLTAAGYDYDEVQAKVNELL